MPQRPKNSALFSGGVKQPTAPGSPCRCRQETDADTRRGDPQGRRAHASSTTAAMDPMVTNQTASTPRSVGTFPTVLVLREHHGRRAGAERQQERHQEEFLGC